ACNTTAGSGSLPGPPTYRARSRRFSCFAARFSFTDFAGFLASFFFGDLSPNFGSLSFLRAHDCIPKYARLPILASTFQND
ncbi:MAG TPA: hypothetical protein VH986_11295, partial [Acidimicrobiia bacterium]